MGRVGQLKSRNLVQASVCVLGVGTRKRAERLGWLEQRMWAGGYWGKQAVNALGLHPLSQGRGQKTMAHAQGQVQSSGCLVLYSQSTN